MTTVAIDSAATTTAAVPSGFFPTEPASLAATGLTPSFVKSLALKYLFQDGPALGRTIARQLALPYGLMVEPLRELKEELLIVYKSSGPLGDYVHELTPAGVRQAERDTRDCSYFGAAPVSLDEYTSSVAAQSVRRQKPKLADVRRALCDLLVNDTLLEQIGMAVSSGMGFFLFGAPGNGKTSIAERVTEAYGKTIWIPRTILVGNSVIRLYDARMHDAVNDRETDSPAGTSGIDRRWIQIRRPTIVVGGELTIENLEIQRNPATGIHEAPLQMKSNCGTLVIDDFGRQRVLPAEMLNRWIVPLEKRHDYLTLANGRKIQVPFDQLVIFSSNLDPATLVDEAFLRRIPYKIEVMDPTQSQFRQLVRRTAESLGIGFTAESIDYLIEKAHATGRCRRFCHAQDLLAQVVTYCDFLETKPELTRPAIDSAVQNYFAIVK